MHFQFKLPEKGRKKVFRGYQTTDKMELIFLDVKVLTERTSSTHAKKLKIRSKKVNGSQNAEAKVRMMFFKVKITQHR